MNEPSVALVFSPDAWVEELHRHCTDHGGARVRHVVVEPRVALDEQYDTLVVSHRWPSLTPAFVDALRERGRRVLGVFDLAEAPSHQHLVDLGVDGVIASDASMSAFVDAIVDLGSAGAVPLVAPPADDMRNETPGVVVAVGGPGGTGATEVAIGIADSASRAGLPTVLIDLDEAAPAIVQRLGLRIEPNVRTMIDEAVYEGRSLEFQRVRSSAFDVVGGLPNPAAWSQVRTDDVTLVLEQLTRSHRLVVLNIGSRLELVGEPGRDRYAISRGAVGVADIAMAVVTPTPVGIVRAVTWCAELQTLFRGLAAHVVMNRSPKDRFQRSEATAELERSVDAASIAHLPEDRRVTRATWEGTLVARGTFTRTLDRMTSGVLSQRRLTREPLL